MNADLSPALPASSEPLLEVTSSRHFTGWMAEQRISLGCTTYQTGKLLLFGRTPDMKLAVFERSFDHCMGLWTDGQTLWMNSLWQLLRLENMLRPGEVAGCPVLPVPPSGGRPDNMPPSGDIHQQLHDRLYVPKVSYITGDLDIHDIVVEPPLTPFLGGLKSAGRVVFVATGFNCLATINERQSFTPLWRPPFVSKMVAEDRCHLNGLALVPGPRGPAAQ
jgi:uncharacterized protein (TIGR03032 family)